MLNDLSTKKDIKLFVEQTYNTYVPSKNISLSLKFLINKDNNYNKKYVPKSDVKIQYLNPNLNEKENRIITNNYIESPFYQEFYFDKIENKNNNNKSKNNDINDINDSNENNDFLDMIKENDEILFYDEKFEKGEKKIGLD